MRRLIEELGKLQGKDLSGLAFAPGNVPNAVFMSATEPAKRSTRAALDTKESQIEDAFKHEMYRHIKYQNDLYVHSNVRII